MDDARVFARDQEDRRGILAGLGRQFMKRPLDSLALILAAAASVTILINAVSLQTGAHPAPLYGSARPAANGGPVPHGAQRSQNSAPEPLIEEIQSELARRGIYDGPIDGAPSARTQAAIRSFQISQGLTPDGLASEDLLAGLMLGNETAAPSRSAPAQTPAAAPAPAAAATPASPDVAQAQKLLNQKGFGPLATDGLAGSATRDAIRRFEASRGVAQRGEITPELLRLLKR